MFYLLKNGTLREVGKLYLSNLIYGILIFRFKIKEIKLSWVVLERRVELRYEKEL